MTQGWPQVCQLSRPAVERRRARKRGGGRSATSGFVYRGPTRARVGAFERGEPAASRGETGRSWSCRKRCRQRVEAVVAFGLRRGRHCGVQTSIRKGLGLSTRRGVHGGGVHGTKRSPWPRQRRAQAAASSVARGTTTTRAERGREEGFSAAAYDAAHGGPWMLRSAAGRRSWRGMERRSSGNPQRSSARSGRCSGPRLGREGGEEGEDVDGAGGQVRRMIRLR